jgi:hypothetical protein
MDECPFMVGDRVLAPAMVSGEKFLGTVTDKRDYQTPPALEGQSETIPQVRVRFDDQAFDEPWIACEAVEPLHEG